MYPSSVDLLGPSNWSLCVPRPCPSEYSLRHRALRGRKKTQRGTTAKKKKSPLHLNSSSLDERQSFLLPRATIAAAFWHFGEILYWLSKVLVIHIRITLWIGLKLAYFNLQMHRRWFAILNGRQANTSVIILCVSVSVLHRILLDRIRLEIGRCMRKTQVSYLKSTFLALSVDRSASFHLLWALA